MLTTGIRAAVSFVTLSSTLMFGACGRSASFIAQNDPLATVGRGFTVAFENEAQTYADVYFVGEQRQLWLGRVAPGALTTLQIPVAALLDNSGYVRLAVLAGAPRTAQPASDPRATLSIAQPVSTLLAQRWTFRKLELALPEITGQPTRSPR